MTESISLLSDADLDHIVGGTNGVVAGPNGEGCTEPQQPTKPGQDGFEITLQA